MTRISSWFMATMVILAAGILGGRAQTVHGEQALNLLFFGNSFTQGWTSSGSYFNVPGAVAKFAVADGHANPLIVEDSIGGASLSTHIQEVLNHPQNNVQSPSIAGKQWDYVVMQGHSLEPTTDYGNPAQFRSNAVQLYGLIKQHSSNVKAILYETWARSAQVTGMYPQHYPNPAAMQAELRNNYIAARNDIRATGGDAWAKVAPVGDAFEVAGFTENLYSSDHYHASGLGYRLSSLVLYRTIYHENVSDISYASVQSWIGLSQSQWLQVTGWADAVAIENPTPEPTSLTLLLMMTGSFALRRRRRHAAGFPAALNIP